MEISRNVTPKDKSFYIHKYPNFCGGTQNKHPMLGTSAKPADKILLRKVSNFDSYNKNKKNQNEKFFLTIWVKIFHINFEKIVTFLYGGRGWDGVDLG